VILTDCCSDFVRLKGLPKARPLQPTPRISSALRCLLFQQRGLVDITASTNETSWGDSRRGEFLRGPCFALLKPSDLPEAQWRQKDVRQLKKLDTNGDGFLTWKEFFDHLRKETNETFTRWSAEHQRKPEGSRIKQKSQMPRTFSLLPDVNPMGESPAFAVVSLSNKTAKTIFFRYRWGGKGEWKKGQLPPKQNKTLYLRLARPRDLLPRLEVVEEPGKEVQVLEAKVWKGQGLPTFDNGTLYSFRP